MAVIRIKARHFRAHPPEKYQGLVEKEFELSTSETVFLLVDVYGAGDPDDVYSVGKQNLSREENIIVHHIRPALDAAREVRLPIVYVSNSAPRIELSKSAYQEKKWDCLNINKDELYAEDNIDPLEYCYGSTGILKYRKIIAPQETDYYIRKHTHSGFFDTRLDTLLRNLNCKTLVCVGFALDGCLGSTMMDALWRNYRVLLLRDCTWAIEIPGIDAPGMWTNRWILYVEYMIGYSSTSEDWIKSCQSVENA